MGGHDHYTLIYSRLYSQHIGQWQSPLRLGEVEVAPAHSSPVGVLYTMYCTVVARTNDSGSELMVDWHDFHSLAGGRGCTGRPSLPASMI
jgi:hypothetical protein